MTKNSRFLGRFNKFTSQRCNTQMLRSSHKEMSLSLTKISCAEVEKIGLNLGQLFITGLWTFGLP